MVNRKFWDDRPTLDEVCEYAKAAMMAMVADVQPLIPADAANSLLPSPTVYCPAAVRNEGRGIASREARKPACATDFSSATSMTAQ